MMRVQLQDVDDEIKFFFVPHVGITTKWEQVENNFKENEALKSQRN